MLNDNITTWLNKSSFRNSDGKKVHAGVKDKFDHCLDAPNYTVFSNMTSAQQWNDDGLQETGFKSVTPLESPHNLIHLATSYSGAGRRNTIRSTRSRSSRATPAPTPSTTRARRPGVAGGTWLTLDSPLDPFRNPHGADKAMTSRDVVNIAELGYAYDFPDPPARVGEPHGPSPVLTVSGINRAAIAIGGSFVVSAWATLKSGEKVLVGTEAVLSRWHVSGCKNCQNHLEVRTHIPVEGWTKKDTDKMEFEIGLHTRNLSGVPRDGPGEGIQKPRFGLETDHL
ncbi:hypothetical protein BDP81DRAFT_492099 [Colletotrichum phormii]|uniref:Uncharacterized protein n=1 Tax=Colletotrichum phormii TaxID=359342 RepID=A0AAI9ZPA2_9PEZI|nr:uncharacterized protein BDP81DRAFT_492099 [Colletotrichum phormii]KAK1635346.1 hypothetical protein BDP81DRAFT_492099 [Colletotrichum phormii]